MKIICLAVIILVVWPVAKASADVYWVCALKFDDLSPTSIQKYQVKDGKLYDLSEREFKERWGLSEGKGGYQIIADQADGLIAIATDFGTSRQNVHQTEATVIMIDKKSGRFRMQSVSTERSRDNNGQLRNDDSIYGDCSRLEVAQPAPTK